MSWSSALILAGYAVMVLLFGVWGLLGAAAHIALLLLAVRK